MVRFFSKNPFRLKAAALVISGWPFGFPGDPSTGHVPPGEDAAFGRLACPSLTRLNLQQKRSEPLLLRSVEVESPKQWKFTLKSDLFWWSGKHVSGEDLATFLRNQICPAATGALGVDASCPKFEVKETNEGKGGAQTATVIWQTQPGFGPYVLNDKAFFRRSGSAGIECAGLYRYRSVSAGEVEFLPAQGYPQKRPELQFNARREVKQTRKSRLEFTFASGMQKGQTCSKEGLFPAVAGILWNDRVDSVLATAPQARKALTQILPRGELLRAGALGLGELVTSFIPRQHPGYNHSLRIRPYSVEDASAALEKIGWQRARADAPRIDRKTGKPVALRILVLDPDSTGSDLVQKVLGDSLALLGIQTEFVADSANLTQAGSDKNSNESGAFDGVMGVFAADWPAVNFIGSGESNRMLEKFRQSNFYRHSDNQRLARNYATSLTNASPDFMALQRFHEKLYEAEVFSPVIQLGTCLDRSASAPAKVDFTDPDWLRLLLL